MIAALSDVDAAEPTDWIVGSWFMTRYGRVDLQTVLPIGAAVEQVDRTSVRLHLLSRSGLHSVYDPTGQGRMEPSLGFQRNQGLGCAAMVGSHWWVVDPAAGTLRTTDPRGSTIPQERWAGVARGPGDELVLADGHQWLVTYDVERGTETRRFPAAVWPSRRVTTGECAPVLVGNGWYGTFSNLTSLLSVCDRDGRLVGHRRLDRLLGLGDNRITAVGAGGRRLGVGYGADLFTFEVDFGPECHGQGSVEARVSGRSSGAVPP